MYTYRVFTRRIVAIHPVSPIRWQSNSCGRLFHHKAMSPIGRCMAQEAEGCCCRTMNRVTMT